MRADRLIALLLLLQNRGRTTAAALAGELEVSVRTVYRDVEALAAAGIPVLAERGPEGGYRLVDGYRTRLTGLTRDEAGSLFLAGMPAAAAELGLGAGMATARLKLLAALPEELGSRALRVQERFHLDASAWFRRADAAPHLATVAEAVWQDRALELHYRSWKGEARREVDPLGLVLKAGNWYLVARGGEAVRTYRVSRVLSARMLERTFDRPAGFDLAARWSAAAEELRARMLWGTARLRVSPDALRLLPVKFGEAGERAAAGAGEPDAQGWVRVELEVEKPAVAVGDLLGLGAGAEVLGPPELREEVAGAVAVLAARYG
ncbi:WYL domain-containing protein [Streptomyces thermolineatus]|uniref:WYL domain-containing protein n=1 Tax=Streptomyces thermolineatus TaxID=44033 RepID=A0ABP5YEX6_9ACTN